MATPRAGSAATFSRNSAHPWASLANRSDSTIRPCGSTATNWCSAPPQSKPPKWVSRANRSPGPPVADAASGAASGAAGVTVTGAVGEGSLMIDAPAGAAGAAGGSRPHVKGPSRVDLIRGPRGGAGGNEAGAGPWGDVLSDVWTGVPPRSGDLGESLGGSCGTDRGRGVTWTVARRRSTTAGVPRLPAGAAGAPRPRRPGDNFCTTGLAPAAELSTMPLRRRPAGRSAASGITSGTVSVWDEHPGGRGGGVRRLPSAAAHARVIAGGSEGRALVHAAGGHLPDGRGQLFDGHVLGDEPRRARHQGVGRGAGVGVGGHDDDGDGR